VFFRVVFWLGKTFSSLASPASHVLPPQVALAYNISSAVRWVTTPVRESMFPRPAGAVFVGLDPRRAD